MKPRISLDPPPQQVSLVDRLALLALAVLFVVALLWGGD